MNGRQFGNDIAPGEQVKLNTTEVWEFVNALNLGEMMDPLGMAHPIHLHGVRFQVIGRSVLPELREGFDAVREGYLDEGWKDTFMMMPGERVKLLMQFKDFTGRFVYHCHNLEHEDQGLMRNYEVKS
jgi:FtsP/CotA-like multicopper oxidase with cupredoxin domain